jgi:hypothetical protein
VLTALLASAFASKQWRVDWSQFRRVDIAADGGRSSIRSAAALTLAEWANKLLQATDGWLLEEYLQQHPDIAAINASSANAALGVGAAGDFRAVTPSCVGRPAVRSTVIAAVALPA